MFNATGHRYGELDPISVTSTNTENFVKQVFIDDSDTFYSFLDTEKVPDSHR